MTIENRQYNILGLSDSVLTMSGYSNVAKNLCNILQKKPFYNCGIIGHNYIGQTLLPGTTLEDGEKLDFTIYGAGRQQYAQDIIEHRIRDTKADIFWVLLDTFMLFPWIMQKNFAPAKSIMYFPTDGGGTLPANSEKFNCVDVLKKFDVPVAMSEFGQAQCKEVHGLKVEHIPHAVHTDVYFPMKPVDREKLKQNFIIYNCDGQAIKGGLVGKFVIGSVFRNQGRKMADKMIKTLKVLKDNKEKDWVFLAHADPDDGAAVNDLRCLAALLGVKHKVFFTGTRYYKGFPISQMNYVYNVMDVFFLSCFHPETEITTNKGFKTIKDITIGDEVLTDDGTFQKIEDKINYEYNKEMLIISTSYNPDVKITPNHYVYGITIKNLGNYQKKKIKENPKIELKPIEEFKVGDYLIVPRIKKIKDKKFIIFDASYISNQFGKKYCLHPRSKPLSPVKIDNDLMWLFGIYLAEGCLSQKKEKPEGIVFCIHTKEEEFTQKILKIMKEKFNLKGRVHDGTRHRRTIWFNSASLGRKFKELFNSGAHNKTIPEWMLFLPKEKQQHLIDGYLDGDGHYVIKENRFEAVTVSSNLAHHLRLILIRLGYLVSYKKHQRQSLNHRLRFPIKTKEIKNSIGWMDENYFYIRIGKIRKQNYKGLVYDLSVSNNHNYCNYWLGKNTSGEGFGIPTLEAASAGIPSVVTDYTTTPELLVKNGKCGEPVRLVGTENLSMTEMWLDKGMTMPQIDRKLMNGTLTGTWCVERGLMDVNHAAECIAKLKHNPELRQTYATNGRNKALNLYSWKIVGESWSNLIWDLIKK